MELSFFYFGHLIIQLTGRGIIGRKKTENLLYCQKPQVHSAKKYGTISALRNGVG